MAKGNNSAKETLWTEAEEHVKHLTNDSPPDPERISHALGFLIRTLKPVFMASFVTEDGLETRLVTFREECPVHKIHVEHANKKVGFFHVPNMPTALTLLGSFYGVMKLVMYIMEKS